MAVVGVGSPSFLYWQLGSSLFGLHPLVKVVVISGLSGALCFALYAGRKRWRIASVLGLVRGIGASGLLLIYTVVFHRQTMWTTEIAIVQTIGALPAMMLFAHIIRRDRLS